MVNRDLQAFSGKRVLLLQGPVGPFFARLAQDLRNVHAQVFKVNLNAGDWFFYPRGAFNYCGTMEDWPAWIAGLMNRLQIEVVLLFGDCRPVHHAALEVARQHELEIGVFEEGYVRPDYVTLERFGVNANSQLPRCPEYYQEEHLQIPVRRAVGNTYWAMAWYAFWYFLAGSLGKLWFRHYRHHRPLTLLEVLPWTRSVWRKYWYRWAERGVQQELTTDWKDRYFLVPLQVFNDGQIIRHADFNGIEHFIETTLNSFARYAPEKTLLVFKHHPMDRGYRDYSSFIRCRAEQAKIGKRVLYIHDQHLPALLSHARGVVVVNSSVGFSALNYGKPTIACGSALYDIPGLTYQGGLDAFWKVAHKVKPDMDLCQRFRICIIATTQLNGSFYKPLKLPGSFSGLVWSGPAEPGMQDTGPAHPAGSAAFPAT